MKTTIRKTCLMLWAGVALASCTKNDDINPDDGTSGDLLLVEEKVNGQTLHSFEYNEDNQMTIRRIHSMDGRIDQTQFSYDSKGLMLGASHTSGGEHIYTEQYTYDSEDRVISGIWNYNDGAVSIQYDYSGNTVSEIALNKEGEEISHNSYTFDNSGKNIMKITIAVGGIVQSTQEYSDYDDKHYRYTAYPWPWKLRSSNNAKSYKLTNALGFTLDHIWQYTYNDAGYPKKAEVYDHESNELVETREFIYIPSK